MPATGQNATVWKDTHRVLEFPVRDIANIMPEAGWTLEPVFAWKMAPSVDDEPDITKTSVSGIIYSQDRVFVQLEPGDTIGLDEGLYYHELRVLDESGKSRPISLGYITLRKVLTSAGGPS